MFTCGSEPKILSHKKSTLLDTESVFTRSLNAKCILKHSSIIFLWGLLSDIIQRGFHTTIQPIITHNAKYIICYFPVRTYMTLSWASDLNLCSTMLLFLCNTLLNMQTCLTTVLMHAGRVKQSSLCTCGKVAACTVGFTVGFQKHLPYENFTNLTAVWSRMNLFNIKSTDSTPPVIPVS